MTEITELYRRIIHDGVTEASQSVWRIGTDVVRVIIPFRKLAPAYAQILTADWEWKFLESLRATAVYDIFNSMEVDGTPDRRSIDKAAETDEKRLLSFVVKLLS